MSVADIMALLGIGGGSGLFVILSLIQISKYNVNPWNAIGKVVGKLLVPGVLDELKKDDYFVSKDSMSEMEGRIKNDIKIQIDALDNRVDEIVLDMEKKELFSKADYYHDQIMLSADKLKAGKEPSQERGRSLYHKILWYENLCETYPEYDNGVCPDACKYLKTWYLKTYGYTKSKEE